MVIYCDTREQNNRHIIDYFDKKGINHKIKKLDYGDYSFMIPKNENLGIPHDLDFSKRIMIERKGSLDEFASNLTRERDRFKKEMALAPETKIIMIENNTYSDLIHGNYRSNYHAMSYWASYHSIWYEFHCPIIFMPNPSESGLFIRGYFLYYLHNYLK